MNLLRPQQRYMFRPARYSPFWAPLLGALGRFLLRRTFRLRSTTVAGMGPVAELRRQGDSILIAPNHADHADPPVLLAVGRRHGMAFHFMAARDPFEMSPLHAWAMQRVGAFSVDREGADLAAVKAALQILREGRYPLVIFPEGEIWHHHEVLDVLNEGVATIALRAAASMPAGRRCHIVPTALRYTCDPSVEQGFSERLAALERHIWWKPRPDLPVVDRIYRLGRGLLSIKEEEHLGHAQVDGLHERIANLQMGLVGQVESRIGAAPAGRSVPERVKTARHRIRQRLLDEAAPPGPEEISALYDDLDRLFLVVQLYSYPVPYVGAQPTVDRIAETIFKLEEDVFGEGHHPAPRSVRVRFGEPIDVGRFMTERGLEAKTAVPVLTRELADAIRRELTASDVVPAG